MSCRPWLVKREAATLGEVFVKRTTDDLAPYAATRTEQVGQKTLTEQAREILEKLQRSVTEQANHNYHLLSAHFRGEETRVLGYFDPRFYDEQQPAHPGHRRERVSEQRTRQVLDLSAADAAYTHVLMLVTEGERLEFARGESSGQAAWPAAALVVEAGKPLSVAIADLPGAGPWLLSRNPTARVAHYHVELRKQG